MRIGVRAEGSTTWNALDVESLLIDNVKVSAEVLLKLVNPDPALFYSGSRFGSVVTVMEKTRPQLVEELTGHTSAFLELQPGLVYDLCCSILDGHSMTERDDLGEWMNVSLEGQPPDVRVDVAEAVMHLTDRGLLERHPEHKDWVRVRDESEAAHGG